MTKKIAYITRNNVSNYGSLLQTYATRKVLEKLGFEAVCINYWREDEMPNNLVNSLLENSRWNKNIMTRTIYKCIQKPAFIATLKRFTKFREKYLVQTNTVYHTEKELREKLPDADIFMTGSDQTWYEITKKKIDPAYFLSFVPNYKKKIAFAASFGSGKIKDEDSVIIKKLLERYDYLSVREKSGVTILQTLGLKGECVLDPTLLLESEEWLKMISNKKVKEKYVLVFQLQPNRLFEKYAVAFAKRNKLKLIRLHPYWYNIVKCGKFVYCPPVEDFLWYIKNAEYLLTDSFHATAFAIQFNTQFIDISPGKTSERIKSILEIAGIGDRILTNYEDVRIEKNKINFDDVSVKILEERQKSIEILKEFLLN